MTTNVINQVPFLRTSRNFPQEAQPLAVEVNKTYVDIANNVNSRIIGLFPTTKPAITGESWFITDNQRQQTLRQVYTFTATGDIPHGINFSNVNRFTRCWGEYTDGTNYYGAIWASSVAIAGQVTFYISPTNIVILAGASAPSITSGIIILEWLSQV